MARYFYTLQILRDSRDPVGDPLGVESPYHRLVEALRWRCECRGVRFDPARIEVVPCWSDQGAPFVEALELSTPGRHDVVRLDLRQFYLREAKKAAGRLVLEEALEPVDRYDFRIAAHRRSENPQPPVNLLYYDEVHENGDRPAAARKCDAGFEAASDFEVLVDEGVLDEAVAMARRAGGKEAGGFLFGRLLRSSRGASPYLRVTALVPAEEGQGGRASFQFTPESWNRGRSELAARGRGEIFAGWDHNHPDMCSEACPEEKRAVCPLRKPFLSEADLLLHETVFAAPYNVALLVSDDGHNLTPSLWGWRDGLVVRRAYSVINPS